MIFIKKRSVAGVTIIEMSLVIVVISIIILFSIQRTNKYQIQSNANEISSSVKNLLDLMTRYYYQNCTTNALTRVNGQATTLKERHFVNSDLISREQYQALIKDPFGRDSSDAYSSFLTYDWQSFLAASQLRTVYAGFWIATVTYSFPASIDVNRIAGYQAYLDATSFDGHQTYTWKQVITTRTQNSGGVISPQAEDLKRFSIQQYLPDSSSNNSNSKAGQNQIYTQDYDSGFRSENAINSCETLEELYATDSVPSPFYHRRGIN